VSGERGEERGERGKTLTTEECLDSNFRAFLSFVHQECLWSFGPDKFMRWYPANISGTVRWKPEPFVWDFGADVVVPDLWLGWLGALAGAAKSKVPSELLSSFAIQTPGVVKGKEIFRGTVHPKTRMFLVAQPRHHFRGEDLVVTAPKNEAIAVIKIWGLAVGHFPQMNPRRDETGKLVPWPASAFRDREFPVNFRFDVCQAQQNMTLDVENVSNQAIDVEAELRGIRLLTPGEKNT
jgi:hypothetical protein